LMTLGKMVPHVQQIHSCHEVYDLPLSLSVTRAWLPLAYDTAIFVMTLWRTYHRNEISPILPALQSEGTLYYIVICSANLVLTVMIVRAPSGLKGVAAHFLVNGCHDVTGHASSEKASP